jgi:hypothetical protein
MLVQGPLVDEETPWVMRVQCVDRARGNRTTASCATAVPPIEGEQLIRWVFIAQHALEDADGRAENVLINPTRFDADEVNRPNMDVTIGVTDPFIGAGDIVLVTLATPIPIPDGVEMPALNWDHVPQRDDHTFHLGFGPAGNTELRMVRGQTLGLVTNPERPERAPLLQGRVVHGIGTENGDSGGAIQLDPTGDVVGIHARDAVNPTDRQLTWWTPLNGEMALRQELERRMATHNLRVIVDPDAAPGGSCMNVSFPGPSRQQWI